MGDSPYPYARYRDGKLVIVPNARFHKWATSVVSVLPKRHVFTASLILRSEFQFCNDDCPDISAFYEFARERGFGDSLSFVVEKCRDPSVLQPFQHPDPYTDDHKILLDFDDMMMTVFLKFTVRPLESVRCPLSRTWRRILKTSGCAFSISSNNNTEYGRWRTSSVSAPPSS